MQFESVCKFNYNRSSDLICLNFIYEISNPLTSPVRAKRHGIYLVTEGTGSFSCGGKVWDVSRGTVFFTQEGDRFSVTSDGELKYFYINFHGRRGDEYLQRIGVDDGKRVFMGNEELISFWQSCQRSAEEGNIDIICEAVLLYSIAFLKPVKKDQNDVVSKMVTMTHENFADPELSISTIAEKLGYDAKYLSSVFKKRKGVPYTQYLRELRLKHAVFWMEQGLVSVKNIAILSGFSDALYFSRIFTQYQGMSPKAYMQKIGQSEQTDDVSFMADVFQR